MKLTEKQLKTIIKESVKRTMIEEGFFGDMKDKFQQKFKMGDYKEVEGFEERLEEYEELYTEVNNLVRKTKGNKFLEFRFLIENIFKPSIREKYGYMLPIDNIFNNLDKLDNKEYDKLKNKINTTSSYIKDILKITEKVQYSYIHRLDKVWTKENLENRIHKNSKKVRNILEQNFDELNSILNDVKNYLTKIKKVYESIKRIKSLNTLVKNLPKYQQALENSI